MKAIAKHLVQHRNGTVAFVDGRIAVLIQKRWCWLDGSWVSDNSDVEVRVVGLLMDEK